MALMALFWVGVNTSLKPAGQGPAGRLGTGRLSLAMTPTPQPLVGFGSELSGHGLTASACPAHTDGLIRGLPDPGAVHDRNALE